ncbi:hypothetical protein NEDG_00700 [Nematocida displodere]|uniref:LsmAD domain-containing protein n=1 Tax=Nematocida displodere TaxID=1805483 RepID=A0A177ECA2_9MICR|nr:hypothetical protein NEDG_00700 [Nematocida displodere]
MQKSKEESKQRKASGLGDKRKQQRNKFDRTLKIKDFVLVKGSLYKILLTSGKSVCGRVVDVTEKEVRLSEFTNDRENEVTFESTVPAEDIVRIDHLVDALRRTKRDMVVAEMVSGTTGYGKLVSEDAEQLNFADFVFFSDSSISYTISIKKLFVKKILKLDLKHKDSDKEVSFSDESTEVKKEAKVTPQRAQTHDFLTDTEIGKKKTGRQREFQPFFQTKEKEPREKERNRYDNKPGEWDQFKANEEMFGVKSEFDESMYTTVLDKNSEEYKKHSEEAEKLARKMTSGNSSSYHVNEERGHHTDKTEDQKYGSVSIEAEEKEDRPKAAPKAAPKKKEERKEERKEEKKESRPFVVNHYNHGVSVDFSTHVFETSRDKPSTKKSSNKLFKVLPVTTEKNESKQKVSSSNSSAASSASSSSSREPSSSHSPKPSTQSRTVVTAVPIQLEKDTPQTTPQPTPQTPAQVTPQTTPQTTAQPLAGVKKLNPNAKSFDPSTAQRNAFFVALSKNGRKKICGPDDEEIDKSTWGHGDSFLKTMNNHRSSHQGGKKYNNN